MGTVKLYIHFGIYKTGSSYLQSLCILNNNTLKDAGFYYPKSKYDKITIKGQISPGNGGELIPLLLKGLAAKVNRLFFNWKQEAIDNGCDKILISAEGLIHAFAVPLGLETLISATQHNDIQEIFAIGYFRDPVDHAISTFKHRAKSGGIHDFKKWLKSQYETPAVLINFFDIHCDYNIKWSIRKYKKDSAFMSLSFFEKWLGISKPIKSKISKVNESVTLSEIKLIQNIDKKSPIIASFISQELYKVPNFQKSKDGALGESYARVASNILRDNLKFLHKSNQFLPKNEQLFIPECLDGMDENIAIDATFSDKQLEIIASSITQLNTITGYYKIIRRTVWKYVSKTFRNN